MTEGVYVSSEVCASSAYLGSNNVATEISTYLRNPILPVKSSDLYQESEFPIQCETEETDNISVPKNSLSTCIKDICVGTEPCTLPCIYDVVDLPPDQNSHSPSDKLTTGLPNRSRFSNRKGFMGI